MAPKWDVHSYHYSVGAGDAAIHLLVDASVSPPKVKGAVLLDGGRAVGFPILKEGIRRLSSQYNCGTDKTGKPLPLQFNSIVISHWDDDHYGGIIKLLRSDFQENARRGTPTKDLKSSYCIYDLSGEPMTTLYAPYWLQESSSTKRPAKQRAYERPGQWKGYRDAATKQQYVNMCIGKFANTKDWVRKVAKLCAETGYGSGDIQVGMLGRNFFYNGGDGMPLRSENDPAQITDVATLINKMTLPNQPGLFCIGADSMLVGTGNVQAKLPPGGVDEPGVIDAGSDTAVNKSSIICIIVRSDGSVLHYFGGDVAYESELLLPEWLKNNGGKLDTERIPVMKLGHHGAATSSPVEFLNLLMPHYVFVSSGAQYGHPRYEVLMYQAALWNFCGQGKGWAIFGRKLLGTTYPTWFRDHAAFSVDAMTQGSQFETWRSEVVNTSKQGSPPLQTFNFENDTWKTAIKANGVVLKHQIADSVEQWWIAGPGVLTPNTMMPMGWTSHIVPKGGKNMYQFQAASAELLARHFHFPAVPTTVPFTHDTIKFGGSAPFSASLQLSKLDLVGYAPPQPPRQFPSSGVVSGNTRLATAARASVAAATSASTLANVTTSKKRKADPEDDSDSGSGATAMKTRPEPAATPFVQNTSVPHADPGDTSYWFVSSIWDPARIVAGRTTVAPAGSDLDNFLCCLAPAALGVISAPPPGAPPKTPVAVLPNEQWYYWLTLFQNIAPSISAHVLTDATASLQGFAIDLNVQVSGINYVLGFSTEATVSELSPASPTSASLSPEGVLVGTATIALGLSDASHFPPTIQLSQICSLVQFRSYNDNTTDASPLLKPVGPQPPPPSFTPYDWGVPFFGLADTVSLTLETQPDDAGQGPRNCLWFSSADAYLTSLRLQFKIDESDNPVLSWLEDHVLAKGVVSLASQPRIIARKQGRPAGGLVDLQEQMGSLQYGLESHIMLNLQLAVNNTASSSAAAADPFRFELFFTFGRADVEMIFLNQSAKYDVGEMLDTLGSCIPGLASDSLGNLADLLPHWFTDVGKIIIREIRLVAANDVTDPSRLKSASVEFEVPFSIHGQATAFHLSFSWPDKTFVASLFVAPSPVTTVDGDPWKSPTLDVRCLPEYEEYMYRPSSDLDLTTTGIPLAGLVPGRPADKAIAPPPGGIDLEVKQLSIQIRAGSTLSVAFRASIASGRPQGQEVAVPPIQVDAVDLMASYDGSELQLILQIQLEVTAPPTASDDALPVLLLGQFEYDDRDDSARAVDVAAGSSSRWSFNGVIENMPLSYLWDFLDPHAQGLLLDYVWDDTGWEFRVFDEPGPRLGSGRRRPSSLKGSPVAVDQLLIIHRPTATKPYVLFILTVSLAGGRSLTFIQLRYPGKNADDKPTTKRIVRFTLEALPDMGAVVPTVNSFAQPFDEMEFVWVHDDSGTGVQRGDVNIFNQRDVLLEDYWVPYKDTFKQPGTTDILLTMGCHFLLNKDAAAILDYGFGAPESSSPQRSTDPTPAPPVSDSNNPPPTMAPLQVTMAHIDGLAADFDSPPLTVAGLLEKSDDIYKGGVVVSLEPYSFLAVGSYGEMEEELDGSVYPVGLAPAGKTKVATFKSFFIFGELDGPIVDLGFLEVLGVKLGFGYNALLRNPTLDELSLFPMMQNPFSTAGSESAANANPMTLLSSFYNATPSPWIIPQNDVLWFAVGLTIVAFELISVTAVIVVDLEPQRLLNIRRRGRRHAGNGTPSEANFVYAEIRSGGFGMRYWFGGSNPYSGDWVYTVGGYHPAYTPAPQYPTPARLAIAWQVNWSLTVTGDAYFAITPKAAMGGGALLAVYSAGPLGAHFDAYADFLINFHPFHYVGDVGVDVGVSFTMDLLFVTLHISCDAGADVHLEGPGFGGVARVHFWLFEFDVPFGDTPSAPGALPWGDFWNLLTQEGKDPASVSRGDGHGSSGGASTTGGPNTAFIYNPVAGSIATDATMHTPPQGTALPPPSSALTGSKGPTSKSSTTAPRPWNVRAGTFRFRVESKMPMTHYVVNAPVGNKPVAVPHADFFIKPMHVCEPVQSSVVAVTITLVIPGAPGEVLKDQFRVTVLEKKAPASIWSQCGDYTNLLSPKAPTLSLPMVLDILAPKPRAFPPSGSSVPPDNIPGWVPDYNGATALVEDVCALVPVPDPKVPCATPATALLSAPSYRCKVDGSDLNAAWSNLQLSWQQSDVTRKPAICAWVDFFGWDGEGLVDEIPSEFVNDIGQEFLSAPFEMFNHT
ncbi:hypothetical protein NEMBOFW57_008150 [Staphylotrichum longicolle]|uniref:DUF6603 domain-containing protein n=1 Tax=Staphylotrichum longicolle TaxID=669026 RepID=A0AAD4HWD1_9PEZI|nr:hypothetical protein NEMBOFW57_008150 [Staphylotrichum longicolle]